jgi:hypothetical protein
VLQSHHGICAYLQHFLVDPCVYFAPQAAFGITMLASIPFPFTLGLDAGAIHKQVHGPA